MHETRSSAAPLSTPAKLQRLRESLAREGLAGFLVPHGDEHQSEYPPPSSERLAWLTGFTGSAGFAIVLADKAAIFVDGRYTLQAAAQVDPAFAREHLIENPPSRWLASNVKTGDRIGYDPWLLTIADVRRFTEAAAAAGAELVPLAANPIDAIWIDRPAPPLGAVAPHPASLAGEEATAKIARLQADLVAKKADTAVLAQSDSIAWLFNIRGSDVAHNPTALAFAVLPARGTPGLFIDGRKLSNSVRSELTALAEIESPASFVAGLAALAGKRVLLDPATTADAIRKLVADAGGTILEGADPVALPKARKNEVELAGMRRAHLRDGAAMVRFLRWLDAAPPGTLDEIAVAEKLRDFRAEAAARDGMELVDLSFDTISGAGPNGAIVHYRVTPETNRKLEANSLYLVDSGAQYRDGTTDITRTIPIGFPTAEMRERFTLVLKGHIAIATARFPVGASGAQLDTLARIALWKAGLDYDHGTGHGVGAFLSVHEGPARISKMGTVPLEPGMILSNEPGYYKTGAYGIRIENLVIVAPPAPIPGGDRAMLAFETITLCPIDLRLVEPSLLSRDEIAWLDAYHAWVASSLAPLLDMADRDWLTEATRPIG
ncbi:MAG: aminopeptidase P family protein [Rhizobiales bacterium]|nr:aminopeptidase P family protein [Hyphomicrobiales bacterium]